MKKTLLAVVLSSVASLAFANATFYSYSDDKGSATLNVYGEAKYNFSLDKQSKSLEYTTNLTKVDTKEVVKDVGSSTKNDKEKAHDVAVKFGFNGKLSEKRSNQAEALSLSYDVRISNKYNYTKTNFGNTVLKDSDKNLNDAFEEYAHSKSGFVFDHAYFTFGADKYGYVSFGKRATLVDQKFDDNSQNADFTTASSDIPSPDYLHRELFDTTEIPTEFDKTLVVTAPIIPGAEALKLGASYGRTEMSSVGALRYYMDQFAGKVGYKFGSVDSSVIYSYTQGKVDAKKVAKAQDVAISASYEAIKNLTLGFGAEYAKYDKLGDLPVASTKKSVGATVEYTYPVSIVNIKPYAGVGYSIAESNYSGQLQQVSSSSDGKGKVDVKTISGYVGLEASVAASHGVTTTAFVEYSMNRPKTTVSHQEVEVTKKSTTLAYDTASKGKNKSGKLSAGLKFSF